MSSHVMSYLRLVLKRAVLLPPLPSHCVLAMSSHVMSYLRLLLKRVGLRPAAQCPSRHCYSDVLLH